jgi:LEA14-like dessication related protein
MFSSSLDARAAGPLASAPPQRENSMKFMLRFGTLTTLLVLSACAFAPKLEAPRLSLVSVQMTSADMFNQQFVVRMNVQNPNDRDLPVNGIDYKLFLEGDSFAEGVSNIPFVIPAAGEKEFDLPVRTNFVSSLGRLLSRLNGKRQVHYVIEGKVMTKLGMIRKVPFSESGTVDLGVVK